MNKAVIFDMDGVLVHSEPLWRKYEPQYLTSLLGKKYADAIGSTLGLSIGQVFEKAQYLGHQGSKNDFFQSYNDLSNKLYPKAQITPGVDQLIRTLHQKGYKLGLVSSSPMTTIKMVLAKLNNQNAFTYIESVNDHPSLRPKPAPDGYIAAMKALSVTAENTIIIEDSPSGVNAGKASGAFVVCFTKYLDTTPSANANAYAQTMMQVRRAIYDFTSSALK